jgi:hypothetical protein
VANVTARGSADLLAGRSVRKFEPRGPFRVGRALVMRISNPAVASMMFEIVFRGQAADWL